MKSLVFFIVVFLVFTACQQKMKVPDVILESFNNLYQNVETVEWEKENGYYEAEFLLGEEEMAVVFDEKGSVIMTEIAITLEALPDTISSILAVDYADYGIMEINRVFRDSLIYYEIELEKDEIEEEIIFAEDGSLFQTREKDEDVDEVDQDD